MSLNSARLGMTKSPVLLWKGHFQQRRGIQIDSLPANGDVQVWPGCAAGTSTKSDFLSFLDCFPLLHFKFRHMEVQSEKALAVVKEDAVAFVVEESGHQNRA